MRDFTYHQYAQKSPPISALWQALATTFGQWLAARHAAHQVHRQQKLDRRAFLALRGKEDWVYRDMGFHRGDVEHLARQPLHINAARELEKIRAQYRMGQ